MVRKMIGEITIRTRLINVSANGRMAAPVAGHSASLRAVRTFVEAGLLGRGIFIPQGFDPDTLVFPGHGTATTVGNESPHLQEWVDRGW